MEGESRECSAMEDGPRVSVAILDDPAGVGAAILDVAHGQSTILDSGSHGFRHFGTRQGGGLHALFSLVLCVAAV